MPEIQDTTDSAHDDPEFLLKAAEYFVEMKDVLIGREDKVIINIANEWPSQWEKTTMWVSTYKQAVAMLREAGLNHTIVIDSGGYGQDYNTIINGGLEVLNSDPLKNVMFSTHMYEVAGKDQATVKNIFDSMHAKNLAVIVGEFGFQHHGTNNVAYEYIMSYAEEKGIGWLAWSWFGNGSPVEYLDMAEMNNWQVVYGADGKAKLTDWGDKVINGTNGWKATAKICSVFTEGTPTSTPTATPTATPTESQTTATASSSATSSSTFQSTATNSTTSAYTPTGTTAPPTNTPSQTTATTAGQVAPKLLGDVNDDSKVDIADVILLSRYLVGTAQLTPQQRANANVESPQNPDIDVNDTFKIVQYVANIITAL
jgi:mannan endo-1,4-beta-mannosidase